MNFLFSFIVYCICIRLIVEAQVQTSIVLFDPILDSECENAIANPIIDTSNLSNPIYVCLFKGTFIKDEEIGLKWKDSFGDLIHETIDIVTIDSTTDKYVLMTTIGELWTQFTAMRSSNELFYQFSVEVGMGGVFIEELFFSFNKPSITSCNSNEILDICLLFDASASHTYFYESLYIGSKLTASSLPLNTNNCVIRFSSAAFTDLSLEQSQVMTNEEISDLIIDLNDISGTTALKTGIEKAMTELNLSERINSKKRIVIFSDGNSNWPIFNPRVCNLKQRLDDLNIEVTFIGFGLEFNLTVAECLTNSNENIYILPEEVTEQTLDDTIINPLATSLCNPTTNSPSVSSNPSSSPSVQPSITPSTNPSAQPTMTPTVIPTVAPVIRNCNSNGIKDVCFLLDASASSVLFEESKYITSKLVKQSFPMDTNECVIRFSFQALLELSLIDSESLTNNQISNLILSLNDISGVTALRSAIEMGIDELSNSIRIEANKQMFVFSDGNSNWPIIDSNKVCNLKPMLDLLNIQIIFFLIGDNTNTTVAECLTDSNQQIVYISESMTNQELDSIIENQVSDIACNDMTFSVNPSNSPSNNPSQGPTTMPTSNPSDTRTINPSTQPSTRPSVNPSLSPTNSPSIRPTTTSTQPSTSPTTNPSLSPTTAPSIKPTINVIESTITPTITPTNNPTPKYCCVAKKRKYNERCNYDWSASQQVCESQRERKRRRQRKCEWIC